MHYVYLLKSRTNGQFYVGSTSDLKRRFYQHNSGENLSTKAYVPWDLVYYEAYTTKTAALERERKLKYYGRGLVEIKKRAGLC